MELVMQYPAECFSDKVRIEELEARAGRAAGGTASAKIMDRMLFAFLRNFSFLY